MTASTSQRPTGRHRKETHLVQKWKLWLEGKGKATEVARALLYQHRSRSMLSVWDAFEPKAKFSSLFYELIQLALNESTEYATRTMVFEFLNLCYQSLEIPMVRQECFRLTSISIWSNLSPETRLQMELSRSPHLMKLWKHALKKYKQASEEEKKRLEYEKKWLSTLLRTLHVLLSSAQDLSYEQVLFVCRCLQFLVELENQLPLRRFVHVLLQDHQLRRLFRSEQAKLHAPVQNWLRLLQIFYGFQVNELTGDVIKEEEQDMALERMYLAFQKHVFQHFEQKDLALASFYQLQNETFLREQFMSLSTETLLALMQTLGLRSDSLEPAATLVTAVGKDPLITTLVDHFVPFASPLREWSTLPLYPVTHTCWVDQLVPPLSLQYLSLSDYVFRHFCVYRRESGYAIRSDVEATVARLRPASELGTTVFRGRSRMALVPEICILTKIGPLAALDTSPGTVAMDIRFSIGAYRKDVVQEWEGLAKGEVVFLVSVHKEKKAESGSIRHIRAATVEALVGYDDLPLHFDRSQRTEVLEDPTKLLQRTLKVQLDRHQYQQDRMQLTTDALEELYGSFNVLVRRHRRENNFWAVLQCIRETFDHPDVLPAWLREVFLGYGDPASVHYRHQQPECDEVYFHSTFLSPEHVVQSFPGMEVHFDASVTGPDALLLRFEEAHVYVSRAPRARAALFQPAPLLPSIPFTPAQVDAIRSGGSRGLTLLVGPPGTGKTDVAVQILCNLYHGHPHERILLLTHSNQALNQLFEKLLVLNQIPERHLLRLGHSDDEWAGYDQYGRVTHFMERRADLLQKVDLLAKSLDIMGDHAYTCETAASFFKSIIQPQWSMYYDQYGNQPELLWERFPFYTFFRTLFPDHPFLFQEDLPMDRVVACVQACWQYVCEVFEDIEQSRAFEVLKSDWDKANLLLARDARIVAMTTTYASLKRRDFIELGFQFDSFVMEEAGTVLEIETFIPLSLSQRVKRVVLIGDHRQLPPVVQCPEVQSVTESLFVRFIRLGVQTLQLDQQGRTRKSICQLYQHVYEGLGHLPNIEAMVHANAGFGFEYQFIDVPDFLGQGEVQPVPHYFQNLGEAEYMVAVYQYMCLLGYPRERVVMLTTYNGQKELLKEVLSKRCAWQPALFPPCLVTTVDKFQGQQADHVLLSLVRTAHVGHVADVRRLVVAMSRARYGLYVFGRRALFATLPELAPTFQHFLARPTQLTLVPDETYTTTPRVLAAPLDPAQTTTVDSLDTMAALVARLAQQRQLEAMESG